MIGECLQFVLGLFRDRVAARKARRGTRPYFIFHRVKVWSRADRKFGLRVTLKNDGPHPAEKLSLTVGLVDCRLDRLPLYEWRGNKPQVSSADKVKWEETSLTLASEMPSQYIYAYMSYGDPMTGESYLQFFARRWRGISDGRASEKFAAVSDKDEAKVRQFVKAAPWPQARFTLSADR